MIGVFEIITKGERWTLIIRHTSPIRHLLGISDCVWMIPGTYTENRP